MKALIPLLIGALMAAPSLANDCYDKFIEDGAYDSRSFQIPDYQLDNDFESESLDLSKEAVVQVAKNLGCHESELGLHNKSAQVARCQEIVPGNELSKVCYLESNVGYFMISKDMLSNVNIIFNRWD